MNTEADDLLAEVLKLPAEVRAKIAGQLLRSLDEEQAGEDLSQEDYDAAWGTEIERRVKDVEDGAVEAISWEEARRRIASDDDPSR